ncbi:MAG: ATP-binding cassette domain-containing protein [Dehalococcoidia bacterium]|nr:ATP-binding cassette domain-containing protein [Dehalococcoidia bacterium]
MGRLQIDSLARQFGLTRAVDGFTLAVDEGEIVALLGPSGCGKTTVLRIVAGLDPEYQGAVLFEGRDLRVVPPERRSFGLMFQDLALFPHMDVAGNVSFGMRMQGLPPDDRRQRLSRLLALVGLGGRERSGVFELSGGERQRVALARSLAPEPRLLMLDEPLGALDRNLRDALSVEIRRVLKELGVSALYVTHDQEEALTVADRVVVMNRGRIEQVGQPHELLAHPASEFVARFLGYENLLPAILADGHAVSEWLSLPAPAAPGPGHILVPEDAVQLDDGGALSGHVLSVQNRGRRADVRVEIEGLSLHLEANTVVAGGLHLDQDVRLSIDESRLVFIPDAGSRSD